MFDPDCQKEIFDLKQKIANLENESQEQSEFLSIISHQLKAPLTGNRWIFKMMMDGDFGQFSDEHHQIIEKGYESNERMIYLLEEIIKANQTNSWDFTYNFELTDLQSYLNNIVAGYLEQTRIHQIHIIFNHPTTYLPLVKIDKKKFFLVIENLIENAIKYNRPNGEIIIGLNINSLPDPRNEKSLSEVLISIKNTGPGIPEEEHSKIFNKFYRASNVANNIEGTGLGLFTVKKIVEKHNGRIWFESKLNQGAEFSIAIPLPFGQQ